MRCPHCNSKLKKNTKFCPECGMTVLWEENSQANSEKAGKGKLAIVVIAILVIIGAAAFLVLDGADWIEGIAGDIVPETTVSQIAFSDDPTAISAASQSVVKLNCYDKNGELYSTGSGFACFADNIIVTNYHVIADNVYSIEASTEDGKEFDITYVLASDKDKDIAILATATPHNLTLLQPGDSSSLQKGEKVVAIGSPLGLLNSVSTGVFSGYVKENSMNVLQFTASISSGSSGGALFNDAGEVLGITFASYEAGQNLNLAIPIANVQNILESKNSSSKMTIKQFYDTFPHILSIDYVIDNATKLEGQEVTVEGYVSYTYGYTVDSGSHQTFGIVANQADVFGYMFTDSNWDYNAAAASHGQEFDGIAIYVVFLKELNMGQFLNQYKPGAYVTCTGTVRVVRVLDEVTCRIYIE